MEKELKEIKEEIANLKIERDRNKSFLASLKIRVFDLETKMNNTIDKLEIIHSLVSKAKKLLEMDKE